MADAKAFAYIFAGMLLGCATQVTPKTPIAVDAQRVAYSIFTITYDNNEPVDYTELERSLHKQIVRLDAELVCLEALKERARNIPEQGTNLNCSSEEKAAAFGENESNRNVSE